MSTILPQRPNTTSASDEPQLPPPCPCPACRTTSRLNSGSCVCDAWRHVRAEVVVGVSDFRFRLHMRTRAASPVDLSRSGPGWSCWSSRGLRAVGRCTVSLFCHVSVLAVYEEEGRTWLGLLLGDLVEWLVWLLVDDVVNSYSRYLQQEAGWTSLEFPVWWTSRDNRHAQHFSPAG